MQSKNKVNNFTLSNLNSYRIDTRDKNSCLGSIKTALLTLVPNNPNSFPTYSYNYISGDTRCSYNGFIRGSFNDCIPLKDKLENIILLWKIPIKRGGAHVFYGLAEIKINDWILKIFCQ